MHAGEPLLAPQEILVAILSIHPQRQGISVKLLIAALNTCINARADGKDAPAFPPEALASALQQLVVRWALSRPFCMALEF
jgi:hypothetical protein